jgi:ABC-type transport system involved in multi-copper enzyme maturation permease subunit
MSGSRAPSGVRGLSARRIRGIALKELRDYRRNRSVLVAMAIYPLIFLLQPLVVVFAQPAEASGALRMEHVLLYMLGIPILVPAALAAHGVAGERQQGSLEPVLTTPIRREEFLLAKAIAALVPSVVIAYLVFGIFIVATVLFAAPGVASAVLQGGDILTQVVYTPLLAALAIWIGLAVSTRSSDARTAQQLSLLFSVPIVIAVALLAFDVIHPTKDLLVVAALVLLVIDLRAWTLIAPLFDRERLISQRGA